MTLGLSAGNLPGSNEPNKKNNSLNSTVQPSTVQHATHPKNHYGISSRESWFFGRSSVEPWVQIHTSKTPRVVLEGVSHLNKKSGKFSEKKRPEKICQFLDPPPPLRGRGRAPRPRPGHRTSQPNVKVSSV